jgi:hypothetical protein
MAGLAGHYQAGVRLESAGFRKRQRYTRLQPRFAYLLPRIASRSDAVADWLRVRYCP